MIFKGFKDFPTTNINLTQPIQLSVPDWGKFLGISVRSRASQRLFPDLFRCQTCMSSLLIQNGQHLSKEAFVNRINQIDITR